MKILDANILIYAINTAASQHAKCREWLENALNGEEDIGFNWVAINGFLGICTRPKVLAKPLSISEAVDFVQDWLDSPTARMAEPTPEHWGLFKELLLSLGIGGDSTTDAHLAALAIAHDATLVSGDSGFARFRRLRWENPLGVP